MTLSVVFLGSSRPSIDRSWNPSDAASALSQAGVSVSHETVDSAEELRRLTPMLSKSLVWPTSYTLGADNGGPLLNEHLQRNNINFVGWPHQDLLLSSKFELKRHLIAAGISTPRSIFSTDLHSSLDPPFDYPVVVKAEYSSTSVGVAVANDKDELREALNYNRIHYGQDSLVEEWCRTREYTVAIIGFKPVPVIAPLEIKISPGHGEILDTAAKRDYRDLTFSRPPDETVELLQQFVHRMLRILKGGDYFRVDVLEDDQGKLNFIDFNFLPGLTDVQDGLSFFPMALAENFGLSYQQSIAMIVQCTLMRVGLPVPTGLNSVLSERDLLTKFGAKR